MSPARLVATWFGLGLAPLAPGTVGTLGALPLYFAWVALDLPRAVLVLAALAFIPIAVFVSERAAREIGQKDPPQVVVDEVSGYLVACCLGPPGWATALLAFVLFRVFDVWKPGPIGHLQALRGGWGIVLDDVAAGVLTALLVLLASTLAGAAWPAGLLPR